MAAVTLAEHQEDTSNVAIYASGAFTPTLNDLLLAFAAVSLTVDAGAYTSSDAGKTYSKVTSALYNTGTDTLYAFVGDQLADADSQTGTMDVTGDDGTGCAQAILAVSGMTNTGVSAIRQSKIAENQAASSTPSITFDSACLTGNPTIFVVAKRGTTTAVPTPTGWTNISDFNFVSPTVHLTVFTRDSGFTGTTISASGTTDGAYCVIAIELDASAGGGAPAPKLALLGVGA